MTGFDETAAAAKRGRRVRAVDAVAGVPVHTSGVVVAVEPITGSGDTYRVAVLWTPAPPGAPPVSWFHRGEYVRFLAEVDD